MVPFGKIYQCISAYSVEKIWDILIIYGDKHRRELPILHYHEIMVIYPYHFLVVITQFFSSIICINNCIFILTGPDG